MDLARAIGFSFRLLLIIKLRVLSLLLEDPARQVNLEASSSSRYEIKVPMVLGFRRQQPPPLPSSVS